MSEMLLSCRSSPQGIPTYSKGNGISYKAQQSALHAATNMPKPCPNHTGSKYIFFHFQKCSLVHPFPISFLIFILFSKISGLCINSRTHTPAHARTHTKTVSRSTSVLQWATPNPIVPVGTRYAGITPATNREGPQPCRATLQVSHLRALNPACSSTSTDSNHRTQLYTKSRLSANFPNYTVSSKFNPFVQFSFYFQSNSFP